MIIDAKKWIRFSLVNLALVALMGVLMRYKIAFNFPYFSQKNIQHAHSHFAFLGWVTQTLFVLTISFLQNRVNSPYAKQYKFLLLINLLCSYGIVVSFFVQGYGVASITLSTLSIAIVCFFTYYFLRDLKKIPNDPARNWFRAGLWFNIASSIGTFYLAYIMMSHQFRENWYLASVYFYLHFQYNGFFIFCCLGLAITEFRKMFPDFKYNKRVFQLTFWSAIPAYFLSVLWAQLPLWLYLVVVVAAFVQLAGWILLVSNIRAAMKARGGIEPYLKYLGIFLVIAFTIKLCLQLGSTIPVISKMAFGFRPVIIAYLHLVLLAVISVFLLTYFYAQRLITIGKNTTTALTVLTSAIFLNELALAVQGAASFGTVPIDYINEILFAITILLAGGALLLIWSQRKSAPAAVIQPA